MSKVKITVEMMGKTYKAKPPCEGSTYVEVEGVEACPGCKTPAPFKVQGAGKRIESHDTYAADAVTVCCHGWVGTIRVQIPTLFGLEEDELVLSGRYARVY